jgi:hypothetical protein
MLHWVHHEKFPTTLGEAEQSLSFLCFCPACRARAAEMGLDAESVRRQVAGWTEALLEDERGTLPGSFTAADLPALFIESPTLYAYLQMRVEIIASLVQEIRDIATGFGVKMEVMPAAWGQPAARAWREGVALRRLAQVSDALLPLCYSADPKEVLSDLRWVKMLSSGARFSVGMSAGHPIAASAGDLAAKAAICQQEGAEGVYYYNYGMLTEERLDWVGAANRQN